MRLDQCRLVYRLAQPSAYLVHGHTLANAYLGRRHVKMGAWPAGTTWQRFTKAAGLSAYQGYASGLCVTPMFAAMLPPRFCPPLPRLLLPGSLHLSPLMALPALGVLVGTGQDMLADSASTADQSAVWPEVPRAIRAAAAVGCHGLLGLPQMALAELSDRRAQAGAHGAAMAYLSAATLWALILEPLRLVFQGMYIGLSVALGILAAAVAGALGGCLGLVQGARNFEAGIV